MPTDLNILKKAFQNVTATYESARTWDEPLSRRGTVMPGQMVPTDVPQGGAGGWVASGGFPYSTVEYNAWNTILQTGVAPPSRHTFFTSPGRAGFNDVDFVPYCWGTNRFGSKGGALIGHPISWEVVGPTGKSPFTHWQWDANVGGPGTNTLDLEAGVMTAVLGGGPLPSVDNAYGLLGSIPNGGLYVLITLSGNETLDMVTPGNSPLYPIDPTNYYYELFRVASIAGQRINLDPGKLLETYFGISGPPGTNKVKAITLIRPKVTRLAAVPLSLDGLAQQNQVFVFLPPETAANSEYMPPYDAGGGWCPDWLVGGFDPLGVSPPGSLTRYGTPNQLPVPRPVMTFTGALSAVAPGVGNQWQVDVTIPSDVLAGQIVRISKVQRASVTTSQVSQTLGWFENETWVFAGPNTLVLNRVPEIDNATGMAFFGNAPTGGVTDLIEGEVYDNIQSIFTDPVLNIGKLVAARLDHLIDPKVIEGSYEGLGTSTPGRTANPPGPAIFDTVTSSLNPGNLANLGFRVVLFPAKDNGLSQVVPDFDHPITTNRVKLDPTMPVGIAQYWEVDYSAGVLYLSNPPIPGPDCTVAPNGIITDPTTNPRNEVVLYAACVPWSREDTQRGSGVRVQTMRAGGEMGANDAVDVYGQRAYLTPDPVSYGVLGTSITILAPTTAPPMTGWFILGELLSGSFNYVTGPCYYGFYKSSTLSLEAVGVNPPDAGYTITANTRILLLKDPPTLKTGYDSDGVRGAAKRSPALNFRATRTSVGPDGTITVMPVSTLDEAYRSNDGVAGQGRTITVDGGAVEARPTPTAGDDVFNASFRVNTNTASTGGAPFNEVGFDFMGGGAPDPYAGFIDRRVFSCSGAALVTQVPTSFLANLSGNTVTFTIPALNWFWSTISGSKQSLLIPYFDLIEIEGKTYIINGFGATNQDITVCNLDLVTVPAWVPHTVVDVVVYRPRFVTSRMNTGLSPANVGSWFFGQQYGANLALEPFGALNLYAGSATALGTGDGGGAVASLAFWSRIEASAGAGDETLLSTVYFDTMGRMVCSLNPDFMQGGNNPDYVYRGDYATRRILSMYVAGVGQSPTSNTQPTYGHIVEDYTFLTSRYDYLSLFPMVPPVFIPTYSGTVVSTATGEVTVATAMDYKLLAYGATVLELLTKDSGGGAVTAMGLFLVRAGDSVLTKLWVSEMNGTHGLTGVANADVITFRLHLLESPGHWTNFEYQDGAGTATTHTPFHIVPVGMEINAVGMTFHGVNRREPVIILTADRHAYRVTMAGNTLTGSSALPSNVETASLDIEGYHKAADYLYLVQPTRSLNLNIATFQPATGTDWTFDATNKHWDAGGDSKKIIIPIKLPSYSSHTNAAGSLTHLGILTVLRFMGNFHGIGGLPPGGNNASVELFRNTSNYTAVSVTPTAMLLAGASIQAISGSGVLAKSEFAVTAPPAGSAVMIDNSQYDYYVVITSSTGGVGATDYLSSMQVDFIDPGPRNY